MDRLSLTAEERQILGKKVKNLRRNGKLPGHVFGKGVETEHVAVLAKEFLQTFAQVGETGLVNLKIGDEKIRPVLVREVQSDPITGEPIHIDFYQVNLSEKVKVTIPLILIGEEPEIVHSGEAIVLQTLNEVDVEALPTDLVEKIEVDISSLRNIDDAITLDHLNYDRSKLAVLADSEEIVVKLAPAVSAEMEQILEEQAAEAVEAQVQAEAEGRVEEGVEEVVVEEGTKEGEKVSGEVSEGGKEAGKAQAEAGNQSEQEQKKEE